MFAVVVISYTVVRSWEKQSCNKVIQWQAKFVDLSRVEFNHAIIKTTCKGISCSCTPTFAR